MAASTPWLGRSHVSMFVHTLHLLNLDQLEDWPDVSIQAFGPKSNLQHRLRCVEWSLYRLFEIYDVKTTRDKLRPFFPPSTSLQSVNLRAALLRQLTDLKKDGALGGNILLRKTMLDECKGDKFEELLAVFSMVVLKKALAKFGDQFAVTSTRTYHAVPLVLSHRKAIQRDLEKRRELDLRTRQQLRSIDSSIHALSEEAVTWKNRKAPAIPKNADTLRRLVRENWIGDTDWVDTVLYGVPPTPGLDYDEPQDDDEDDTASILLTGLDCRIRAQNARLAHWQQYMKSLENSRPIESTRANDKTLHSASPSNRFMLHQNIVFDASAVPTTLPNVELSPRYAELLEAVDRCVASKSTSKMSLPHFQVPIRSETAVHPISKATVRPTVVGNSSFNDVAGSMGSETSSQGTVVGDLGPAVRDRHSSVEELETSLASYTSAEVIETPAHLDAQSSLAARTRASLALFETPRAKLQRSRTSISPIGDEPGPRTITARSNKHSNRASLLDRTRQSMSLLTNVLEENYQPRTNTRSNRARHSKSKSMYIPSQRPRLERAWSEESLTSVAKDDSFDVEADYESVFKSRPRLAMSPNLSPARNSDNLDGELEDALNKLTISSSSPDY